MQLNRAVQKLFTLGVTLGLVALLASGCLTAGNSFTVKEDGSIDVNMVMLFNRETLDALGSMFGEAVTPEDFTTEIEDQFTSDLPIDESRVDIKEIDDERGVGINVTLHFEDYEEMKEAMSQGDSGDGDDIVADVEITQDGSKWTFIGTAGDPDTLAEEGGMSQYSDMIDVNLPEPEMYIEVTLPGKIIDSNGEVDGSTVRWDLMDKNLDQNLKAVSDEEASGGFPTFLLLLGGMVLVVAVASFVVISQKKKSNGGQNGSYNPYDQGISKTPDMPPGWYPDPNTPGQQRWWDGQAWSDHTG